MIILLFFSILSLTAISQNAEKKITIQNKNISLKEAFEQIELQTDYSIAYEQSNLNLKKRQALSLKSASIEKALTQILKGTGYIIQNKGISYYYLSADTKNRNNRRKDTKTNANHKRNCSRFQN